MTFTLTEHEKLYLAEICQLFIEDWPGVEEDAPGLYAAATKFIDWVDATR